MKGMQLGGEVRRVGIDVDEGHEDVAEGGGGDRRFGKCSECREHAGACMEGGAVRTRIARQSGLQ
jgi:hypothetical protein